MATFDFLDDLFRRRHDIPIVCGGDWNATYSDLPVDVNPGVFSMRALPSLARTERIFADLSGRKHIGSMGKRLQLRSVRFTMKKQVTD